MVKSTVRLSEDVVSEVESLVADGHFESKSEFYRFASDYVLEQLVDSYDPVSIDYEEIKQEIAPSATATDGPGDGDVPFFESVVVLRKYALRGNLSDAEDFIDHQYEPNHPHAIVLEDMLELYRSRAAEAEPRQPPQPPVRDRHR